MSQKYSCGQKWRASFSPSHPSFSVSGSGMTVSLIQSFNLYSSIFYKNNRCVTSFPVEYMHHTFSKHLDDCKVTQLICTWHRPTNTTKSTIQPITVNETRNLIYTKLRFQISSLYKMSFFCCLRLTKHHSAEYCMRRISPAKMTCQQARHYLQSDELTSNITDTSAKHYTVSDVDPL